MVSAERKNLLDAVEFVELDSENWETCKLCGGTGQDSTGEFAECYESDGGCDGTGKVRKAGRAR